MQEQGVVHPEDYVLNQYQISADMNRIPVPVNDDGLVDGILLLYPEEALEQGMQIPQSGGVFGTVKSIFRSFGFFKPKEIEVSEEPISKAIARGKHGAGLYAPKKEK